MWLKINDYTVNFRYTGEAGLTFFDETSECKNCSCEFKLKEYLDQRGDCPACTDDFPFLDLKELEPREQYLLKEQLRLDLEDIKNKFNSLCNATRHWLTHMKVAVPKLIACLDTSCDDILKSRLKESKSRDGDIDSVFEILRDHYITFLQFGHLETIINQVVDQTNPEIIKHLEGYKKELEIFLKRRIFFVPCSVFMKNKNTDKTYLVVKAHHDDKDWICVCTGNDLAKLQMNIAKILKINPMDMNLGGVKEGCIELAYQVPTALLQDGFVFPLSSNQQNSLGTLGISRLQCGIWKYVLSPKNGISLLWNTCIYVRTSV